MACVTGYVVSASAHGRSASLELELIAEHKYHKGASKHTGLNFSADAGNQADGSHRSLRQTRLQQQSFRKGQEGLPLQGIDRSLTARSLQRSFRCSATHKQLALGFQAVFRTLSETVQRAMADLEARLLLHLEDVGEVADTAEFATAQNVEHKEVERIMKSLQSDALVSSEVTQEPGVSAIVHSCQPRVPYFSPAAETGT